MNSVRARSVPRRLRAFPIFALCAVGGCAASNYSSYSERSEAAPAALTREQLAAETSPLKGATFLTDTESLLRRLREVNRDVAAEAARITQAQAGVRQAELWQNPNVNFALGGVNAGRRIPNSISYGDSQNYTLGVAQTFELGKRGPRTDSAKWKLSAEKYTFFDLLGDKAADARQALADVSYLHARIALLEESLRNAQQVLTLEQTRLDQGDISGNDMERLRLDTSLLELDLSQVRAELASAESDVKSVLGSSYTITPAQFADLNSAAAIPESLGDGAQAIASRPDLVSLEHQAASAKADAELARRRAIPDPQIGINYTHDNLTAAGNQPDTVGLSVGVSLPIFDRGQHDSTQAEAHAWEIAHTRAARLDQATAVAASLRERRAAVDSTLQTMQQSTRARSQQVLDTTLAAYNRGQISLTDLLLARRTHTDLLLRIMELQRESFSVRNELRRTLGLDAQLAKQLFQNDNFAE